MPWYEELDRKIAEYLPDLRYQKDEPMSSHCSFRVGGPARRMAFPERGEQLVILLQLAEDCTARPLILGKGSNVLPPDGGLERLVIETGGLAVLSAGEDGTITAEAGVPLARLAEFAAQRGLAGLEFAHGIPGTVGGGVYMNAGAYGSDISRVCVSAEVMDKEGHMRTVSAQELDFSYRHSALEDTGEIVVSATFRLTPEDPERIRNDMKQLQAKRLASQPLNLPSAGSAFKRPAQGYAAALIDEAGLKGYRVGDAAISEKHAGFAVNLGHATAAQVRQLLYEVAQKVKTNSGITLEPEVRIWK